jgi:hypothetical protein
MPYLFARQARVWGYSEATKRFFLGRKTQKMPFVFIYCDANHPGNVLETFTINKAEFRAAA